MTNQEFDKMVELSAENRELNKLILKLLKEYKKLEYELFHDPLTGAYNRRILEKERDYGVVAMCDIDNFKRINDTLGHAKGDEALKALGELFLDNCRDKDFVLRNGGDEFVLVFKDCSIKDAYKKMQTVRELAKLTLKDALNYDGSISVGLAEYEAGKDLKIAMQEADEALYESKENGKDRITVYREKDVKVLEKEIS